MEANTSAPTHVSGSQFHDVDRSEDPQARVRYLDVVTQNLSYKAQALASLRLQPGDRILDAGCGTGDDARLIAEQVGPAGRVVGLDASETMIAEARRREQQTAQAEPVEFQVGDLYHLPFPDDTFDAARADRVFQHLTDPLAGLLELRRVTRPGGRVSVVDPDWETLVVDVPNRALFRKIRNNFLDTHHGGPYRGSQLYGLFHRAGLQDVRVASALFVSVTDYDLGNQIADLDGKGEAAFGAGAISAEEHAEWLDTLRTLRETGPFFAGGATVCIVGIKP